MTLQAEDAAPALSTDPLDGLGVRLGPGGGELRVFSATATRMELCLLDGQDPDWAQHRIHMQRDDHGVWTGSSPLLVPGRRYSVRAEGPRTPRDAFAPGAHLLDPYTRGLLRTDADTWRSVVVDDAFDWRGVAKPATPLEQTVVYEAHAKGLTRLLEDVPPRLRGTYAGLGHASTIDYLHDLGVTAVQLLPVQAFSSERRLAKQGLANYWGYNTVAFFAPHAPYASLAAQGAGPQAVLKEFKAMVRALHEAGLEVYLDVVYNHTAEESLGAPPQSFRGLDNSTYYRQDDLGRYVDSTGCGNTIDYSREVTQRLVLDSIRYWANEMQIDGFRFDLAVALARDEHNVFRSHHPLLRALRDDPGLAGVKLIAEPWDIGMGGWQTGGFPTGWSEWNDRYRDTVRDFWLTDAAVRAGGGLPRGGVGGLADCLAGSSSRFAESRGPLASVDFVTAHDGFTLADLTAYNGKHNLGNGESNRDGTDNNRSFNFGVEGATRDEIVLAQRRRAMRNLLGTLLLSAGVPMLVAGDEQGRSQGGNNNAYCQDGPLTWLAWELEGWQHELLAVTKRLIALRRENPALRPTAYARRDEVVPGSSEMHWFDGAGRRMHEAGWTAEEQRTLQYLARSNGSDATRSSTLLVVHGDFAATTVVLPSHEGIDRYTLLWSSADDAAGGDVAAPGDAAVVSGPTMLLYRAE